MVRSIGSRKIYITGINFFLGDESLDTGIETIDREEVPDFKERFDQFIIRHVKGKLVQELIVRLQNGFPTTEREAAAFDAQKEKNDKLYEAHVRAMLSVCESRPDTNALCIYD